MVPPLPAPAPPPHPPAAPVPGPCHRLLASPEKVSRENRLKFHIYQYTYTSIYSYVSKIMTVSDMLQDLCRCPRDPRVGPARVTEEEEEQ